MLYREVEEKVRVIEGKIKGIEILEEENMILEEYVNKVVEEKLKVIIDKPSKPDKPGKPKEV